MRLTSLLTLVIFISCNMSHQPQLSLLTTKRLTDFSSASAIEFYKGKFYIIGDDSRYLLIMDKQYNVVDTIVLFPGDSHRIPKKEKADLEAATIIQINGDDYLMALGSGSTPERESYFLFPLHNPRNFMKDSASFYGEIRYYGIEIINIEGLAIVEEHLVFANRANLSQRDNYFLCKIPPDGFCGTTGYRIIKLELPDDDGFLKGVSGLSYVPGNDLMLFTASVELTANAVDDGAIGNSYVGYITGFSKKMTDSTVRPDTLINLSALYKEFENEKVESICVESVGKKEMIVHLVADNDDGTSTLFKLSMPTPPRQSPQSPPAKD